MKTEKQSDKTVAKTTKSAPTRKKKAVDSTALTAKERAFCVAYLRTYNPVSAARQAGIYKRASTDEGYELLLKPHIQLYIQKLKKAQSAKLLVDGADIVKKYMDIAFADVFDFVRFGYTGVATDGADSLGITISNIDDENMRMFLPTAVDGSLVTEIKQGKDGITVKLADRMKALAWLTDYFELNPSDVHRRETDKRKLELAAVKLCTDESEAGDDESEDGGKQDVTSQLCTDNYTDALSRVPGDIWGEQEDEE